MDEIYFFKWVDFMKIKLHSNENIEWMKWFSFKWVDFMKIKLHSNENIEWMKRFSFKWVDFVKIKLHSNENMEWMKWFLLNELILWNQAPFKWKYGMDEMIFKNELILWKLSSIQMKIWNGWNDFFKWVDFVRIKLHSNENMEWMKWFF